VLREMQFHFLCGWAPRAGADGIFHFRHGETA
jgi:hypothetical protein